MLKLCSKCLVEKAIDNFSPTVRNIDGSVKYRNSWCHQCKIDTRICKQGGRIRPIPKVYEDSKECLECREIKSLDEFSPASRGRMGRAAYCKPCSSKRIIKSERYQSGANVENTRKYRRENPEKCRAAARISQFNRRSVIKATCDGTVTEEFLKSVYAKEICYWCKKFVNRNKRTLEHIKELSQGGVHSACNITMSCSSCNSARKGRIK